MILKTRPRDLAADSAAGALDSLTPEQVVQRKNAIWSHPRAVDLTADSNKYTIVAEGDSWFDYLPGIDILDHLQDMGNAIAKVAKAGDTLENMVYGATYDGHFNRAPNPLDQTLQLMKSTGAKILLFSGGGNDIAGDELEAFLNHRSMALGEDIRTSYANHVFGTVVRTAYQSLIQRVHNEVGADKHIITHGYGYPVPDGRGVINFPWGWHFFGPWLRPALTKKDYVIDQQRSDIMRRLVDQFNGTLEALARNAPNFHYLNLRPLIGDNDWVNELHLKSSAYRMVAERFEDGIRQVQP